MKLLLHSRIHGNVLLEKLALIFECKIFCFWGGSSSSSFSGRREKRHIIQRGVKCLAASWQRMAGATATFRFYEGMFPRDTHKHTPLAKKKISPTISNLEGYCFSFLSHKLNLKVRAWKNTSLFEMCGTQCSCNMGHRGGKMCQTYFLL